MSAVLEKKCFVSSETTVILKSLCFLMCRAAVIPEIPLPMIRTCFMMDLRLYNECSLVFWGRNHEVITIGGMFLSSIHHPRNKSPHFSRHCAGRTTHTVRHDCISEQLIPSVVITCIATHSVQITTFVVECSILT